MDKRSHIIDAIDKKLWSVKDCMSIWGCSYTTAYNRIYVNVLFDSNDADLIINRMNKKGILPKEENRSMLLKAATDELLSITVQSIASLDAIVKEAIADGRINESERKKIIPALRNYILTTKKELEMIENLEKSLMELN